MPDQQTAPDSSIRKMTGDEWEAEGARLFGPDKNKWRFVCPCCKHVASVQDWKDANAFDSTAFSCIGRALGPDSRQAFANGSPGPCNYTGGGLFKLNPIEVEGTRLFAFAEPVVAI